MADGCMKNAIITIFTLTFQCMMIMTAVTTAVSSSGREGRAGHLVSPPAWQQRWSSSGSSVVAHTVVTTTASSSSTTLPLATRLGSGASGQAPSPFGPTGPDTAHECPTRPVWTYGGTGPTPGGCSPPRRLTPVGARLDFLMGGLVPLVLFTLVCHMMAGQGRGVGWVPRSGDAARAGTPATIVPANGNNLHI